MSNESTIKTIFIATIVCLICSIFVSTASVKLKPLQELNKSIDINKNILFAAGLNVDNDGDIGKVFSQHIKTKVLDLDSGDFVENFNLNDYDYRKARKDPKYSENIPAKKDIAGIKKRSKYAIVYFTHDEAGNIDRIILRVYGKGLWSTLYGFIALDKNLNTIKSFSFYENGETPGLGGEVDNPRWKALWVNKKVYDNNWNPKIEVIKGKVQPSDPNAQYEVDGLSGATITSRSVTHILHYWMGENGYGPFLSKIRDKVLRSSDE